MQKLILTYLGSTLVFLAIDLLWLGIVAKNIYGKYLKNFLTDQINWTAAIIFYLFFIAGIIYFAVHPAAEKDSLQHAVINGALFGFFTYATYDLTNLATLKGWPIQIVFIDIIWGMILTASVATAGFYIMKSLG